MDFLSRMQEIIPLTELEAECVKAGVYKADWGRRRRPSLPCQALFGSLLLQAWYGLSDLQTEEFIWNIVSFRTFLGLSVMVKRRLWMITTIFQFRNALMQVGLFEWLFERVRKEVKKRGWLV